MNNHIEQNRKEIKPTGSRTSLWKQATHRTPDRGEMLIWFPVQEEKEQKNLKFERR